MRVVVISTKNADNKILQWSFLTYDQLNVSEASEFDESLRLVKTTSPDLIFIDERIEDFFKILTAIRALDKLVFIVVLAEKTSAFETIFDAGADDIDIVPLSLEILKKRIRNYFRIIEYRKLIGFEGEPIHCFKDKKTLGSFCTFKFLDDGHVIRFWEHFTHLYNVDDNESSLQQTVLGIYNLGLLMLHRNVKLIVFFEMSEHEFFFTISRVNSLNPKTLDEVLQENFSGICAYKVIDRRLYLAVSKSENNDNDAPTLGAHNAGEAGTNDLEKIENLLEELEQSARALTIIASFSETCAFADTMESLGKILTHYDQSYELGIALSSLGASILEYTKEFLKLVDMKSLCLNSLEISSIIKSFFIMNQHVEASQYQAITQTVLGLENLINRQD